MVVRHSFVQSGTREPSPSLREHYEERLVSPRIMKWQLAFMIVILTQNLLLSQSAIQRNILVEKADRQHSDC